MTTTLHTIVDFTADVLEAATLPGTPTVHRWRLLPFESADLPAVAVVCNSASDAPLGIQTGPANWTRTFTLAIVAVPAPTATDEALGSAAVALGEAILDALFASEPWCNQMGQCPPVEMALAPDRTADGRYCPVSITIRGEHSIQRAYATPATRAALVHYTNTEAGGAAPEGQTQET